MSVERFVRFVDENGAVAYGELSSSATTSKLEGISVPVLSGNPFDGFSKAGRQIVLDKNGLTYRTCLGELFRTMETISEAAARYTFHAGLSTESGVFSGVTSSALSDDEVSTIPNWRYVLLNTRR